LFISAVSALLGTFLKTFWAQSVVSEVYTLNAFFFLATIFLLLLFKETKNKKSLYWLSFLYGLSLTNHNTMLLLAPLFVWWLFIAERSAWMKGRTITIMLLLFILGISFYLYLPLRSLANPPLDWNNPETLKNFLNHITRHQYGKLEFFRPLVLFWRQVSSYLGDLFSQLPLLVMFLGFPGLTFLFKRERRFFFLTFFSFLFTGFGFVVILNPEVTPSLLYKAQVFYIPSHLIFTIWIGSGIGWLFSKLNNFLSEIRFKKIFLACLLPGLILFLPFQSFLSNYASCNKRENYIAQRYGEYVLDSVEKEGIFFTVSDEPYFILTYFQKVEGKRKDIAIILRNGLYDPPYFSSLKKDYPDLKLPSKEKIEEYELKIGEEIRTGRREEIGYSICNEIMKDIISLNPERPVYSEVSYDPDWLRDYAFPLGVIFKIGKEKIKSLPEAGRLEHKRKEREFWEGVNLRNLEPSEKWVAANMRNKFALYFDLRGMTEEAIREYKEAIKIDKNFPQAHYGLGLSLSKQGKLFKAIKHYQKALRLYPRFSEAYIDLIDPQNSRAHHNLGVTYKLLGRSEEAISSFKAALRLNPFYVQAHYNLSLSYLERGLLNEASSELKKVLELNPNHQEAQRRLEDIEVINHRGDRD
jgi:tetratricopeptide (TPR) repeat protein